MLQRFAGPLAILMVGVAAFVGVYAVLQRPAPPPASAPEPAPGAIERDTTSVAARIGASQVAVGVPTAGWEPLLRGTRAGDRLNVMATLPTPIDGRPATAVVVNGARVLQPAAGESPMLLEVPASDAMVLAHLVLGGTPLAFAVWPADGSPPAVASLDEEATRSLFGLMPRPVATVLPLPTRVPEPTVSPAPPTATPVPPTATTIEPAAEQPTQRPLPDSYVVRPGQTLGGIAAELGVDEGALWWANRHLVNPSYVMAGMELSVPRFRGFMYQVRPGDSWFVLSRRFGLTPEYLRQRNELPDDAPLDAGTYLFVPLSP